MTSGWNRSIRSNFIGQNATEKKKHGVSPVPQPRLPGQQFNSADRSRSRCRQGVRHPTIAGASNVLSRRGTLVWNTRDGVRPVAMYVFSERYWAVSPLDLSRRV